jgi:hypothetical protein
MKRISGMTMEQLVERFAAIALDQHDAILIAPEPARRLLRTIADSGSNPQAGDAGMSLVNLERGIFKPS